MVNGRHGYLDKEIAPGKYIVEVSQIGGYIRDMDVLKDHWKRRSSELCPSGFSGELEVIDPLNARIEEFRCPQRFCEQYPMVSGIIECDKSI